jgi:hypothetical protein
MTGRTPAPPSSEPGADPFREHRPCALREQRLLLGARIGFETDSAVLLDIARRAFAGLPAHRFDGRAPSLRVTLIQLPAAARPGRAARAEPAPVWPLAGSGLLGAAMGAGSFIAIDPTARGALVAVAQEHLKFPYHVRYELIEFAVYMLAARAQGLVPLHAACVGRRGSGVLLLGPSGAGKSTLMLQCLARGLELLAEDSVLVQSVGLRATGLPNFLHVRPDSARFVETRELAGYVRASPVIQRRSGVRKFEIDLRQPGFRLAGKPLRLRGMVFLSAARARGRQPPLRPLSAAAVRARLRAEQPYAASQRGWDGFVRRAARLPGFELRRGGHPRDGAQILDELLDSQANAGE